MFNQELSQEITKTLQGFRAAKTNNFLKLAQVAGLDISSDLAGANLRGVNLSRLNLSHADLSDTDLRDAKLSGADLSSADLSGADLSGASLISANLSHANLSNAQVTGTRFGKNPGLVEQTKDNLIKRGGIWEPSITEVLLAWNELNDRDRDWMIATGESKEIPAGHVLIHEGESINALYIVLDGVLTVSVEAWKSREIARLSNGEVVGEMSFVKDHPPSATVKALEDSIVWSIDRAKLTHKLKQDPRFAARFYRLLAAAIADRIHLTTISLLYFEKEYQIEDPMATHLSIDELTTSSHYRFMATPIHKDSIKTYEKVILDKTKAALLINGVIES